MVFVFFRSKTHLSDVLSTQNIETVYSEKAESKIVQFTVRFAQPVYCISLECKCNHQKVSRISYSSYLRFVSDTLLFWTGIAAEWLILKLWALRNTNTSGSSGSSGSSNKLWMLNNRQHHFMKCCNGLSHQLVDWLTNEHLFTGVHKYIFVHLPFYANALCKRDRTLFFEPCYVSSARQLQKPFKYEHTKTPQRKSSTFTNYQINNSLHWIFQVAVYEWLKFSALQKSIDEF